MLNDVLIVLCFFEGGGSGMEEYVFKLINFNVLFLHNFPIRLVQHYLNLQAQ